jgi:hypothetical protein
MAARLNRISPEMAIGRMLGIRAPMRNATHNQERKKIETKKINRFVGEILRPLDKIIMIEQGTLNSEENRADIIFAERERK